MEYGRHVLPSSFGSHSTSLEDLSGQSRIRQPLASSAGNAQHHTLASEHYHEDKGQLPRFDGNGHMYPLPALPSQPARPSAGYTLEQRRQSVRQRRDHKFRNSTRNPIVDSPQYQAYRSRQTKEGNGDDQKWPPVLEDAFIDALGIIPYMGRRKFSYRGKPHGRNELIMEYIWIYYVQSLSPGEVPDETMRRTRKQVSSHIQVIKAFMKNHPDFHKIFPSKEPKPLNGFEPSFKNDPCLRAISEGRLPSGRLNRFNEPTKPSYSGPIRPSLFWLLITTHEIPEEQNGRFSSEEELYKAGVVAHKFSSLSLQRPDTSLETIPNWQHKFPALEKLRLAGNLKCDIIHMDVALDLMSDYPERGAELCCRTELSVPGTAPHGCDWISRTTLTKPAELCQGPGNDLPIDAKEFRIGVVPSHDSETRFKVPFPANAWANVFVQLIGIQKQYRDLRRSRSFDGQTSLKSARQCIDELSMYQEIVCSSTSHSGERTPPVRKAIILWTFHKTSSNEPNSTSWRYVDASYPQRRSIMSPSPHHSHHLNASMYDNYNSSLLEPSSQMQLSQQQAHQTSLLEYVNQGLVTPPQTAGLQSPFAGQSFTHTFNQSSNLPFEISNDNLSFMNHKPSNSEANLTEHQTTTANNSHLEHYLSTNIQLPDYDPQQTWSLPTATTESFDADPNWTSYAAAAAAQEANQAVNQINWGAPMSNLVEHKDEDVETAWHSLPPLAGMPQGRHLSHQVNVQDMHRQSHSRPQPQPQQRSQSLAEPLWEDAHTPSKRSAVDWLSPPLPHPHNTPSRSSRLASIQEPHFSEQSIEQRLLPWIEQHESSQLQAPHHHSSHRHSIDPGARPEIASTNGVVENENNTDLRGGTNVDNLDDSTATAAANSILDMTVQAMTQGSMEERWGNEGSGEVGAEVADDGFDYAGLEARLKQ